MTPLLNLFQTNLPRRRQAAFTLVELLVVIAIIGILVALLLPAVQAARAAARRSQCQNQLKQIGLACLNYESTNGALPPGSVGHCDNDNARNCITTGWAIEILPYLEEQQTFDLFDFTRPKWYGSTGVNDSGVSNAKACETYLSAFVCPSDESTSEPLVELQGEAGRFFAPTSYRGVSGAVDRTVQTVNVWWDRINPGQNSQRREYRQFRGPLPAVSEVIGSKPVKLAQITDGMSKTALVGEHHTPNFFRGPVWASSWNYHNKGHFSRDENSNSAIYRFPDMEFCATPSSTRTIPPTLGGNGDNFLCYRAFGSTHAGSVIQFVYCDGSIHAVRDTIDDDIYLLLGTIADGELLVDVD